MVICSSRYSHPYMYCVSVAVRPTSEHCVALGKRRKEQRALSNAQPTKIHAKCVLNVTGMPEFEILLNNSATEVSVYEALTVLLPALWRW